MLWYRKSNNKSGGGGGGGGGELHKCPKMTVFAFWFDSNKEQHCPFLGTRVIRGSRFLMISRPGSIPNVSSGGSRGGGPGCLDPPPLEPEYEYN